MFYKNWAVILPARSSWRYAYTGWPKSLLTLSNVFCFILFMFTYFTCTKTTQETLLIDPALYFSVTSLVMFGLTWDRIIFVRVHFTLRHLMKLDSVWYPLCLSINAFTCSFVLKRIIYSIITYSINGGKDFVILDDEFKSYNVISQPIIFDAIEYYSLFVAEGWYIRDWGDSLFFSFIGIC